MDHGWIRTHAAARMPPRLGFAVESGSGTPVPDLSVEVDDLAEALARIRAAGIAI